MTKERWDRLRPLFFELAELAPEQRHVRRAALRVADPELERQLERLLQAHDSADSLLGEFEALMSRPAFEPIRRTDDGTSTPDPLGLVGRVVSHYDVVELLGAGGMGVLYRAVDTRLGRHVALKFLPPHWGLDETYKRRFLREARAVAALDHPNVCSIHEIGETRAGQLFLAMPFYEGETVRRKIARGPLEVEEALDLARQTAEGLAAAHAAGLAHRDIKPANLIVTPDGTLRILDFGLAKTEDTALTDAGVRLGTPAYMSPEQARGERVDERTDLWSLGVVLYEMLTGRRPFAGDDDRAVLEAIRKAEPEPPGRVREDLTPEVESLVVKLLSKDPNRRSEGARWLAEPHLAPRSRRFRTTSRSRNERIIAGAVGLVLVLAIGVIGYVVVRDTAEPVATAATATNVASGAPTIAVLPFEGQDGAGERAATFADGLHEEMLALLSALGLRVTPRTSVMEFSGSNPDIREVAETLGVDHVLRTRVVQAGERVRIDARLFEAGTAEPRWAESYSDSITVSNLRTIQIDMARGIAGALGAGSARADWEALGAEWTDDLEAYELFLRGVSALRSGGSTFVRSDLDLAVRTLERAVAMDPEFAAARVALANAQIFLHYIGADRSGGLMSEAKRTLDEVLGEHPDLAVAHHVLGRYHYHRGDYARALLSWLRSEELEPGGMGFDANLANVYRRQGRWEEALAYWRRALELDPLNASAHLNIAATYHFLRRYEEAGAAARRSLELRPTSPYALSYAAKAAIETDGPDAARRILETAPAEVASHPEVVLSLARLDQWAGEHRSLLQRTGSLVDMVPVQANQIIPFGLWRSRSLTGLGDSVAARVELEGGAELLERLLEDAPDDDRALGALGMVYAALGREEEAIAAALRGVELLPVERDAFFGPQRVEGLALVYAWTGHVDEAVELLEYLLSIPSLVTPTWLRNDPAWDPLRGHPRFEALLGEASQMARG